MSDLAEDHIDDVRKLTNLMLPEVQTILARQRKVYGIDQDEYEMEYPIFEQAENIDEPQCTILVWKDNVAKLTTG